jgi:MraZ protein
VWRGIKALAGELFSGSGLEAVDARGRVHLPRFVRETLARRSDSHSAMLGVHETDDCLTGFDPGYAQVVHAELERRRLRDEAAGIADAHHGRIRRAFGLTEERQIDDNGRIALPDLIRRRGRIEGLALFVGTGGAFEVWDPERARAEGGEELRALADYWLGARGNISEREEEE